MFALAVSPRATAIKAGILSHPRRKPKECYKGDNRNAQRQYRPLPRDVHAHTYHAQNRAPDFMSLRPSDNSLPGLTLAGYTDLRMNRRQDDAAFAVAG